MFLTTLEVPISEDIWWDVIYGDIHFQVQRHRVQATQRAGFGLTVAIAKHIRDLKQDPYADCPYRITTCVEPHYLFAVAETSDEVMLHWATLARVLRGVMAAGTTMKDIPWQAVLDEVRLHGELGEDVMLYCGPDKLEYCALPSVETEGALMMRREHQGSGEFRECFCLVVGYELHYFATDDTNPVIGQPAGGLGVLDLRGAVLEGTSSLQSHQFALLDCYTECKYTFVATSAEERHSWVDTLTTAITLHRPRNILHNPEEDSSEDCTLYPELWEQERRVLFGWSHALLRGMAPWWSSEDWTVERSKAEAPPTGYTWAGAWEVVHSHWGDKRGWGYATSLSDGRLCPMPLGDSTVRRRRWRRKCVPIVAQPSASTALAAAVATRHSRLSVFGKGSSDSRLRSCRDLEGEGRAIVAMEEDVERFLVQSAELACACEVGRSALEKERVGDMARLSDQKRIAKAEVMETCPLDTCGLPPAWPCLREPSGPTTLSQGTFMSFSRNRAIVRAVTAIGDVDEDCEEPPSPPSDDGGTFSFTRMESTETNPWASVKQALWQTSAVRAFSRSDSPPPPLPPCHLVADGPAPLPTDKEPEASTSMFELALKAELMRRREGRRDVM